MCVVENSSRAPHSRNFPNANTYNFFSIQLCCMSKRFDFDFVFRISYIEVVKKESSFKKSQHSFSLVFYSIVTLCDLCWHIVLVSHTQFYSFCFYFYFDVWLPYIPWVFVNSYRHMQISLIVIEPRSNKRRIFAADWVYVWMWASK